MKVFLGEHRDVFHVVSKCIKELSLLAIYSLQCTLCVMVCREYNRLKSLYSSELFSQTCPC